MVNSTPKSICLFSVQYIEYEGNFVWVKQKQRDVLVDKFVPSEIYRCLLELALVQRYITISINFTLGHNFTRMD
jgi:hypothetical protein